MHPEKFFFLMILFLVTGAIPLAAICFVLFIIALISHTFKL